MKRIIMTLAMALMCVGAAFAQNDKADNILGKYSGGEGDKAYKLEITKLADGTYQAQIYWLANPLDKNGEVALDTKNSDKALRSTPMDKVVLIKGLKYNPDKQQWGDAKIYDPERGIKANATARFENSKDLIVRGTVLGIGESVTWSRIQ